MTLQLGTRTSLDTWGIVLSQRGEGTQHSTVAILAQGTILHLRLIRLKKTQGMSVSCMAELEGWDLLTIKHRFAQIWPLLESLGWHKEFGPRGILEQVYCLSRHAWVETEGGFL